MSQDNQILLTNEVLKKHILFQKLMPCLERYLSISKYEIQEIVEGRSKLVQIHYNHVQMLLGVIKTLELLFAEDKIQRYDLQARFVSGKVIELMDLDLRLFLRREVERVQEILQDLTK